MKLSKEKHEEIKRVAKYMWRLDFGDQKDLENELIKRYFDVQMGKYID